MFYDSKIAASFSMGKTKLSYVINYDWLHIFLKYLQLKLKVATIISYIAMKPWTKKPQKHKMDIVIRFFKEDKDLERKSYDSVLSVGLYGTITIKFS